MARLEAGGPIYCPLLAEKGPPGQSLSKEMETPLYTKSVWVQLPLKSLYYSIPCLCHDLSRGGGGRSFKGPNFVVFENVITLIVSVVIDT